MRTQLTPVKEIYGCDPESLPDEVLSSNKPLILRGLVAHWPAVAVATQEIADIGVYLKQFDSGRQLNAMLGDPSIKGRIFYNESLLGFNFDYHKLT